MKTIECTQGDDDWHQARCGIPTASEFVNVMRTAGKDALTRQKYMRRLAAERITGKPVETYTNAHMQRGSEMEPDARRFYELLCDEEVTQVGFITNDDGTAGCSPDSLVGKKGMLEIKTKLPDLQIELILNDTIPSGLKWQLMGNLWLGEREWIELVFFWPGLPMPRRKIFRNDKEIKILRGGVAVFNEELDAMVEKIKRYGKSL